MLKQILLSSIFIVLLVFTTFSKSVSPQNPLIQYYGRMTADYEYDWPGFIIKASFTGTSISARFKGNCRYNVFIDGIAQNELVVTTENLYPLSSSLEDKTHEIIITKRSETNWSSAQFLGFEIDETAELVDAGNRPNHRIEYIGDSFMVGYGNEHPSNSSGGETEYIEKTNTYLAFPAVSARALGVEYQVNAYSGLGVVNDCNGVTTNTLPAFYDYTLQSKKSGSWDFKSWIPDIVVIGLGINDFNGGASKEDYKTAYHSFIERIRNNYDDHPYFVVATTSVYQHPEALTAGEEIVNEQQAQGNKVFLFNYEYFDLGFSSWSALHWHPYIDEHAAIGESLASRINNIISTEGWPEGVETKFNGKASSSGILQNVNIDLLSAGKIQLSFNEGGIYTLKLFTLNGKSALHVKEKYYSVGTSTLSLNKCSVSESVYVVVVEGDGGRVTKKIVLK